jgi:hypothetical protein
LLDRGQTFDRLAFVSHDGVFGKALGQGFRIPPVLGVDIKGDGCWKFRRHSEI